MKYGPVLSETLDLINYGTAPWEESYWETHIVKSGRYEVSLAGECAREELSDAEMGLIHEIHETFGGIDQWALVERLHRVLPEWRDPRNAALPIRYEDILAAGGDRSEEEIDSILDELMALGEADRLLDVAD